MHLLCRKRSLYKLMGMPLHFSLKSYLKFIEGSLMPILWSIWLESRVGLGGSVCLSRPVVSASTILSKSLLMAGRTLMGR